MHQQDEPILPGAIFFVLRNRNIRSVNFWTAVVSVQDAGLQTGKPGFLYRWFALGTFGLGQVYERSRLHVEWEDSKSADFLNNKNALGVYSLACLGILLMDNRYSLSRIQFPRAFPKHLNKSKLMSENTPTLRTKPCVDFTSSTSEPSSCRRWLLLFWPFPVKGLWTWVPHWHHNQHLHGTPRPGGTTRHLARHASWSLAWHHNSWRNASIELTFSWTLTNALTPT